jgi:tetratricopeptide (TPR) repeat protein
MTDETKRSGGRHAEGFNEACKKLREKLKPIADRLWRDKQASSEAAPGTAGSLGPAKVACVDELRDILDQEDGFRDSNDRLFERLVSTLLSAGLWREEGLDELEKLLTAVLGPRGGVSSRARYVAFYALCMKNRREQDAESYRKLINEHEAWAGCEPSFLHLRAMMLALNSHLGEALTYAEGALEHEKLREHAGVRHHYAELVATLGEESLDPVSDEPPKLPKLEDARKKAEQAIKDEKNYAKFYATLGRLKALANDFEGARQDLQTAIQKERGSWDSAQRRGNYKDILMDIGRRRRERQLNARIRRASEAASQTSVRHAEMLGFFAGVLALILTGVQLGLDAAGGGAVGQAGESTFLQTAKGAIVLLMLTGTLLVAYGGLGFLLRGEVKGSSLRSLVVAGLGLFLILIVFLIVLRIVWP